jgi:hypothetical protein
MAAPPAAMAQQPRHFLVVRQSHYMMRNWQFNSCMANQPDPFPWENGEMEVENITAVATFFVSTDHSAIGGGINV